MRRTSLWTGSRPGSWRSGAGSVAGRTMRSRDSGSERPPAPPGRGSSRRRSGSSRCARRRRRRRWPRWRSAPPRRNCRTNLGGVPVPSPSRSWKTRTCPSHAGPAPMPMVGTSRASVTAAPTTSGTPSITKREAPGRAQRLGRVEQSRRRVDALALHPEAAHGQHRLGGQPEMAHDRDLRLDDGLDDRQPGPSALELHRLGAGPDQRRRVAHGVVGRQVVAHPRHVAQDEAARLAPGPPPPCGGPSPRCRRASVSW